MVQVHLGPPWSESPAVTSGAFDVVGDVLDYPKRPEM